MQKKDSFQAFSKKLDLADINFLLSSKEEGINWSEEKSRNTELWYRRFLFLHYLYPGMTIVPTKDVDTYWHHHIMDTEKYYSDCMKLFGAILHHYPYLGTKGEDDKRLLSELFYKTNELYDKHFKEQPTKASKIPNACSGGGERCGGRRFSNA